MPLDRLEAKQFLGREFLKEWFLPPRLIEAPSPSRRNVTVGIIGAGIAGLCAGHELSRLGYATTLFEAAPRLGGRLYTHRFSDDQYGELGAMRIPEVHSAVKQYVNRFGLRTRPFRSSPAMSSRTPASEYESILKDIWKDVRSEQLFAVRAHRLEPPFSVYEGSTLRDFLSARLNECAYRELLVSEHMKAYEDSSFLETVLGFLNYKDHAMYELEGGMSKLVDAFANSIRQMPQCAINTGMAVESITIHRGGVSIDSQQRTAYGREFDVVILAIPPSAVSLIRFTPPLPTRTSNSLASNYIAACKTVGLFKRAFWKADGIEGGVTYTDGDSCLESVWYPSSRLRVLTLQYSRGEAALRFADLPSLQKEALIVETLRTLHPASDFILEDMVHESWQSPRTGGGGFCRLRPGQFLQQCEAMPWAPIQSHGDKRLFFAGEAYSLTHGWLQGAIESGLRTVQDILKL